MARLIVKDVVYADIKDVDRGGAGLWPAYAYLLFEGASKQLYVNLSVGIGSSCS